MQDINNNQYLLEDEKGVIGRGLDVLKSKILKTFKSASFKAMFKKYEKLFYRDIDKIIKKYAEIAKDVSMDFVSTRKKLEKEYEDLKKDDSKSPKQIAKDEEELKLKLQDFKEDIDGYFKLNDLNAQADKLINTYSNAITERLKQKNWLLNVELSDKHKKDLELAWEKRLPLIKLELNRRFIKLANSNEDIREIYSTYNKIKLLIDRDEYENKINLQIRDISKRDENARFEITPVNNTGKKNINVVLKGFLISNNDSFSGIAKPILAGYPNSPKTEKEEESNYTRYENKSGNWDKFYAEITDRILSKEFIHSKDLYIKGVLKIKGYDELIYSDVETIDTKALSVFKHTEEATAKRLNDLLYDLLNKDKTIENRLLYLKDDNLDIVSTTIAKKLFENKDKNIEIIKSINKELSPISARDLRTLLLNEKNNILNTLKSKSKIETEAIKKHEAKPESKSIVKPQYTKPIENKPKQTGVKSKNQVKPNVKIKPKEQSIKEITKNGKTFIETPDNKQIQYDFETTKDGFHQYFLNDKLVYKIKLNEGFIGFNDYLLYS